jgi:hypothetical protein
VSLESLLSELLVATILDGIHFESVGVRVNIMVLGEEVRNGVEGSNNAKGHTEDDLGVWDLMATEVRDVLSDVVGHLGSGGGGTVVVLDHTIVKLGRHSNNHVIVVGVEVTTLGHIKTKWRCVMVTSEQVVGVVGDTRLHRTGLGQLRRPDTLIGVLGLMDGHVRWPDSVLNLTLSEVPLLEVVRTILLMTGVDLGQVNHLGSEFDLGETFVDKEIILLMHSTVAALTGSAENLKSSSQSIKKGLVFSLQIEVVNNL